MVDAADRHLGKLGKSGKHVRQLSKNFLSDPPARVNTRFAGNFRLCCFCSILIVAEPRFLFIPDANSGKPGDGFNGHNHMRTQQAPTDQVSNSILAAPRPIYTLKKFAERHSDFTTLSSITNQVFKAQPRHSSKGEIPGNGMLDFAVIMRIGRKVLIDEAAYFRWLDAQQKEGH